MAFLEELKERAMDLAQTGVAKSKQLAEIARLNVAIAAEEEAVKKVYIEIGKLYYAEQGMAPDPAYAALCEKVTASRTTVEESRARLAELKAEAEAKDIPDTAFDDLLPEEPSCDCCQEEPSCDCCQEEPSCDCCQEEPSCDCCQEDVPGSSEDSE